MKRIVILLLLLFLIACSNNDSVEKVAADDLQNNTEVEKPSQKEEVNQEEAEVVEPEDNRSPEEIEREGALIQIGDTANEDGAGKVELLNIAEINEVIEQGSLKIDLINAKVLNNSEIPQDLISYLTQFGDVKDSQINYLQIRMIVENTSDQDIVWDGISTLVTDKKEQIDGVLDDFMMSEDNLYFGIVKKELIFNYILDDADINNVRVIFSPVLDEKTYEEIEPSFEHEIVFE
ncbi:hypothetical protein F9U64_05310 [Gracilibacillus oryzae]|uniref:DUF4352 domain-containing protein n=1 Tax=Gracilibacillus oryzae TaxID=1672701 RepID=A0A7C8KRV7_9BACI|nr:hypothetical protein [Gracilibacillus oryzae]KAB8138419.1 hypothetical protein F9U64_05310 [Gracilibacillus oryzae]